MDPEYAWRYRELYERHWWWRAREELVLEAIRRSRPAGWQGSVLDVGCGDGLLFDRLAEFGDVEGVEADRSIVSESGPHRSRIHIAPFDERFRPDKRYGLILMLDVLEHLLDRAGALRHALALLRPDGVLVVTVPAFPLIWTTHDDLNRHYVRYTRRSFRALAREVGLHVEVARYFFHAVFAAKLGVRLLETMFRRRPSLPRLPPRWLNRFLYRACRLEQRLLTPLPVPVGSSLLVVGRRAAPSSERPPLPASVAARPH